MTPLTMELSKEIESEEQEQDDDARHSGEPKANVHGVYVDGIETITIALPKSYKATATLHVVQGTDGQWRSSYNWSHANGGGGSIPSFTRDPVYGSREEALFEAADGLFGVAVSNGQAKVAEKVGEYRYAIDWTKCVTNGVATDPLVPESALDEVGTELGNLAGQSDVAASDDADASPAITDDPTVKPAKKTAEQKALDKATKHYLERKRNAEENLSNCVLRRRDCEAALKGAKGSEKAAAELLESVLARGPEQLPLFDKPAATASDAAATDTAATAETAPAIDPDAWKSAPLSALGLPPSLEEKLTSEGMDTIGRLEQRRADISQGKEKWPKGIGPAKVTLIEDAVVGWLTENQHQCGQDEHPAGDVPAAALTDAELDQLLIDRAKALNTGDAGCLDHAGPTEAEFTSGQEGFGRGLKLTDCPYDAGTEQDDWLRGWMYGNELKNGETISSDLGDL